MRVRVEKWMSWAGTSLTTVSSDMFTPNLLPPKRLSILKRMFTGDYIRSGKYSILYASDLLTRDVGKSQAHANYVLLILQ